MLKCFRISQSVKKVFLFHEMDNFSQSGCVITQIVYTLIQLLYFYNTNMILHYKLSITYCIYQQLILFQVLTMHCIHWKN